MKIKVSTVQTVEIPDDMPIEEAAQLFQNPLLAAGEVDDDEDDDSPDEDGDDDDDDHGEDAE